MPALAGVGFKVVGNSVHVNVKVPISSRLVRVPPAPFPFFAFREKVGGACLNCPAAPESSLNGDVVGLVRVPRHLYHTVPDKLEKWRLRIDRIDQYNITRTANRCALYIHTILGDGQQQAKLRVSFIVGLCVAACGTG